MGMLDDLLGAALGGQGLGSQPSQPGGGGTPAGAGGAALAALLPVVMSMLSQGHGSSGGGLGGLLGQVLGGGSSGAPAGQGGGLGGLLKQVEAAGFGDHARSWVGTGPNQPISPDAIGQIFGQGGLADIAQRAGLSHERASAGLAQLLPAVVNHLTPDGRMPSGSDLESALGGLLQQLGK